MTQLLDFKKELKELLFKYSATINMNIDGDTHGTYNEHLTVSFLKALEDGDAFRKFTDDYKISDGMSLNSNEVL